MKIMITLVGAFVYGWLTGRIPAPSDPSTFWIGNLAAPYVVIGFLAGAYAVRKVWSAMVTGAAAAVSAVCGFYNVFAVGIDARRKWGLPPAASELTALRVAYQHWLHNLLLSSRPWLLIGLIAGAVAGYFGWRWARRRERVSGLLLGACLIVEPALYFAKLSANLGLTGYAYSAINVAIWSTEAAIGVAVIVLVRRSYLRTDVKQS